MRLWLLSILACISLFGFENNLLLRAEISIFPKLLLLTKEPQKILVNGGIVFTIVYEDEDIDSALTLKTLMDKQYKGFIENYPFSVILVQYSKLDERLETSAIMALRSKDHIDKPAKLAIKKKVISFVEDVAYLKEGYLFSLNLERSTIIYMNKPMLRYYGIEFSDTLYHVVRFFDENKESTFTLD